MVSKIQATMLSLVIVLVFQTMLFALSQSGADVNLQTNDLQSVQNVQADDGLLSSGAGVLSLLLDFLFAEFSVGSLWFGILYFPIKILGIIGIYSLIRGGG